MTLVAFLKLLQQGETHLGLKTQHHATMSWLESQNTSGLAFDQ